MRTTVTREEFIASILRTDSAMTREIAERLADHDLPHGQCAEFDYSVAYEGADKIANHPLATAWKEGKS